MIGQNIVFVDTNIFVYAHQPDHQPAKQPIARELLDRIWAEHRGRTSVQVLNECYSNLTRKTHLAKRPRDAWTYVVQLMSWKPCPIDIELIQQAYQIEWRYGLNWWDCLIVAAAQRQCCTVLLTEDLDNEGIYDGVRVYNPFKNAVQDAA